MESCDEESCFKRCSSDFPFSYFFKSPDGEAFSFGDEDDHDGKKYPEEWSEDVGAKCSTEGGGDDEVDDEVDEGDGAEDEVPHSLLHVKF